MTVTCPLCLGMYANNADYNNHIKRNGCQRRQDALRYRRMIESSNRVDDSDSHE